MQIGVESLAIGHNTAVVLPAVLHGAQPGAQPRGAAANFLPSLLKATSRKAIGALPNLSVHDCPESVDVQIVPPMTTAASFVPSLLEAIPLQEYLSLRNLSVHDCPESVDVQMPS